MFRKKLRIKYNDISNEGMLFEKLFDTAKFYFVIR